MFVDHHQSSLSSSSTPRLDIATAASLAAQSTTKKQLLARLGLLLKASRYIILLLLFILGIRTAFHTFLHRNQFSSDVTNTLCSGITSKQQLQQLMHPRKSDAKDTGNIFKQMATSTWSLQEQNLFKQPEIDICKLPPQFQFKKFIWLLTDGLPVKYSTKTLNHYAQHSVLYTIDIPGPKYSHAIYTSYLTGQLPTNYQGSPITGDSLIKSMQRSPSIGPLTYIGPEWSFLAISGKQNYKHLFKKIIDKPEPLDQPHDRAYRFFFKDQESKDWLWKTLNEIDEQGGSLFTHSAIFDHINHGVFRNNPTNTKYLDYLANRIADDINTLKAWIDKHPDYLLILSSDHGCDDVSNGYVLHGYSTNGNEGYVMLYNPSLIPHKERIDVVDVAPTIAKYLDQVDIPADNIGVTRAYYGNTPEAKMYKGHALKQNMIQLADTSKRRGVPNVKLDLINNLLKMTAPTTTTTVADNNNNNGGGGGFPRNDDELNRKLGEVLTGLKMNLYKLLDKPYYWVAYYAIQSFAVIMILIFRYNYNSLLMMAKGYLIKGLKMLILLVPMYFGAFLNILFVWDDWKGVIRSGGPFYVWHAYLALLVIYFIFRVSVSIGSSSSSSSSHGNSDVVERDRKQLLTGVGKRFLWHSLIDASTFMLFTLFRKQWKRTFDLPALFYLPYLMLLVFIFISCNMSIISLLLFPVRLLRRLLMRLKSRSSASSSLEDTSQQQQQQASSSSSVIEYIHLIFCLILFSLLILFEMTSVKSTASREEKEKWISYYYLFGFHIYYAIFLGLTIIYFFITMLINTHNLDRLIIPATLYAFAIMRDTPHGRILTLVMNYQYFLLLVPLVQKINSMSANYRRLIAKKKMTTTTSSSSSSASEKNIIFSIANSHAWDMLQQAIVLFLLNQPLFQFVVGKEEKLNVDAHPFAGAIGMRSHQEYPSFNAFQMAFEKWHTILLFALFLWKIVHRTPQDATLSSTTTTTVNRKQSKVTPAEREEERTHNSDLIVTVNALLLFNANMFLQLMLCFIGMNHPFEDSVVYLIVMSVIGASFTTFHLITQYFSFRKMLGFCIRSTVKPSQQLMGAVSGSGNSGAVLFGSKDKDREPLLPVNNEYSKVPPSVGIATSSLVDASTTMLNRGKHSVTTPVDSKDH